MAVAGIVCDSGSVVTHNNPRDDSVRRIRDHGYGIRTAVRDEYLASRAVIGYAIRVRPDWNVRDDRVGCIGYYTNIVGLVVRDEYRALQAVVGQLVGTRTDSHVRH